MKTSKILATLLLCTAICGGARAQYSDLYYHRTGDTIEWRAPNGYYAWWEFEDFYNNNLECHLGPKRPWSGSNYYDSTIVLHKLYTPTPLKIIGIAGAHVRTFDHAHYIIPDTTTPVMAQEYYYIYEATPTDFTRVAEAPWSPFDPYRTVHVKMHSGWHGPTENSCCGIGDNDHYFRVYEYYFDSAIYVTDSFYVGGSIYGNIPIGNRAPALGYLSVQTSTITPPCNPEFQSPHCLVLDYTVKMRRRQENFDYWFDWEYSSTNNYTTSCPGLVYPIIEVDTTVPPDDYCMPVSNVEVPLVDSSCATVTWDNYANYTQVLLQYGPINTPPESWNLVDVSQTNTYRLCGLNPSTSYGVRLKALCEKRVTPWSEVTGFYNPPSPSTPVPSVLSEQTFVNPNPAQNELWVSSSFGLSGIDIHSANGVLVYSDMASGHLVRIPLDGYAPGTYLVTIHTHFGTTTKKIVKQ